MLNMSSLSKKMNPMALQQQFRRVAVNQAVSTRPYSSFYPKIRTEKKVPGQRSLKTTKHDNTRHDESTVDFAYMPREDLTPASEPEQFRVPLLPDNVQPPLEHTNNAHHDVHMGSIAKPTISTVSATGTHIDSPSAMSDVTDNHAQEIDVFGLTRKVSAAASSKATQLTNKVAQETDRQRNSLASFVSGVLDDVFGPKRA